MPRLRLTTLLLALLLPAGAAAQVRNFDEGSLIIPMDLDYQDDGMFQAFGLIYQLLLADVTVHWAIDPDKEFGEADFTASATDFASEAAIEAHGYRAGPFIVDEGDAAEATPIVEAWQQGHVTTVHIASAAFTAPISRTLTAAPTIAVFADGSEDIAFDYLNAAAIPDSTGQAWPDDRDPDCDYPDHPDVLCLAEVRGESDTDHSEGALFGPDGLPVYCQIMTMHWAVNDRDEEVIAEFRAFLDYPTHLMAECQAVNAIENAENGHFLTPNGYEIGVRPDEVEVVAAYLPFAQFDGAFETVGGSEPSYSLPEGDTYYDDGVVMVTEAGEPALGVNDVWMTGYVGGLCLIDPKGDDPVCEANDLVGKVSYLGGHRYSTATPVSENPDSQGTRLFLNSLFEADCATTLGQPNLDVTLAGPDWTPQARMTALLTVDNAGPGLAHEPRLVAQLPDGATFVSANPEATSVVGGSISWTLGTLDRVSESTVSFTFDLPAHGTYETAAHLDYVVGLNDRRIDAVPLTTVYSDEDPNPGDPGADDVGGGDAGGGDDVGAGDGGASDGGADAGVGDASGDAADEPGAGGDAGAEADGAQGGGAPASDGCDCATAGGGGASWEWLLGLAALLLSRRRRLRARASRNSGGSAHARKRRSSPRLLPCSSQSSRCPGIGSPGAK